MKTFKTSVHIFRRDLRLEDNTALMAALSQSERVLPIFIFDKRQLENPYHGKNSFEFMVNSLLVLDQKLKERDAELYFFKGGLNEILNEIISKTEPDALFVNRDYTPFSRRRDDEIAQLCKKKQISFNAYADALLNEPEQVSKPDGKPYTVFTPYMKKAKQNTVAEPVHNLYSNYFTGKIDCEYQIENPGELIKNPNPQLLLRGGRKEGLSMLEKLSSLYDYEKQRNIPSKEGTSLLSAHHKFGTVSVRETHQKILLEFGGDHPLINELYWRDFFTHIVWHFPHVLGNPFKEKYNKIEWENNTLKYEKWCAGETGFPIVDAGMRELVNTGYMHNRVRMVVASFLTKDLHVDWKWGERFFAKHLIDYDPAVNNGNWQWAASTGCDAQPYFRVFNPWSQQLKFDADCKYIKKWVHELSSLTPKQIHILETKDFTEGKYPRPIVNHKHEAEIIKQMFKILS
jgi:deoxyribodipyrimidine photo-lyase